MRAYYEVLDYIKEHLQNNGTTNLVHKGWFMELDLSKNGIYPLATFEVSEVSFDGNSMRFKFRLVVADLVEEKEENQKDADNVFHSVSNVDNIHNTQLFVVNNLQNHLKRADFFDLDDGDEPLAEPFKERFENLLAGWTFEFTVLVPNDEISLC